MNFTEKFIVYLIGFILIGCLWSIFSEPTLTETIKLISLDTFVLSTVIIFCSHWIVKTVKELNKD